MECLIDVDTYRFAAYLRRRPLRSQRDLESLLAEYSACAGALRKLIEELQELESLLSDAH